MSDITLYSQLIERNEAIRTRLAQEQAAIASEFGLISGVTTWDPITWQSQPMLNQTAVGNKQFVVQNTDNAGCGRCCLWTVPAGATRVQFQVWGAGANGVGGECCAWGLPGANGAYATIIIDAVPGCQYTLCAGCAECCCVNMGPISGFCYSNCWTTGNVKLAASSFVTGSGLTNFCAQGGYQPEIFRWKASQQRHCGITPVDVSAGPSSTYTGTYLCGQYFCINPNRCDTATNSCRGLEVSTWPAHCVGGSTSWKARMNDCIPWIEECCTGFFGTPHGVRGYWPALTWHDGGCMGHGFMYRYCFAPVHAFDSNNAIYSGPTIGAWSNQNGNTQNCITGAGCINVCCWSMPGRGGAGSASCSGNCGGGCRGHGGAVRVSWC